MDTNQKTTVTSLKKRRATPPPLIDLTKDFAAATAAWAMSGFPVADEYEFKRRLNLCENCIHWNAAAWGVGRCMKCGCAGTKLWMKTSRCPLRIWEGQPHGDAAITAPALPPKSPPDAP